MLLFYFIGISALFVLFEIGLFRLRTLFYFMNYGWGKALTLTLLALLIFAGTYKKGTHDFIIGIWFILIAIIFVVLSIVYR